uniref:DUF2345 domain-containing protein n=1 Tax=Herbaspirillum rubrisubalbicans TaxID=80842 RepID=UPI000474B981
VSVTSVNDSIEIKARHKIVVQAGQSCVTLEDGNITFACPGTFSVKGAAHAFPGGARHTPIFYNLPDTRIKLFDQQIRAINESTNEPIIGLSYELTTGEGNQYYGITDKDLTLQNLRQH